MFSRTLLLDLPTLFLAAGLSTFLLAGLLFAAWRQAPEHRALAWWGGSYLVLLIAIPLLAMRSLLPPIFPFGLSNGLFIVAGACAWIAARRFEGRSYEAWWAFTPLAIWLALYLVPAIGMNPPIRMAIVSIGIGGFLLAGAYEFWRGRREPLISRWPAIITMAALGIMLFVRVPFLIFVEFGANKPPSDLQGSLTIVAMLGFVYIVIMACNILAMTKERSELAYRHQARTDALTQLLNRGAFLDEAEAGVEQANAAAMPISIVLVDLDRFKQVNDRFGHLVGDLVLQALAQTATAELPARSLVGRVGGEEFAVLLHQPADQAAGYAERLRQTFDANARIVDGQAVEATLSAGVSTMHGNAKLLTLMADADRALYAAKESGRNIVRVAQVEIHADQGENAHSAAA